MADNYLEKRMEDLQSGRLGNSGKSTRVAVRPTRGGYLNIPFPERRVLITEGTHGLGRAIALAFRKADCRTAVFDTDKKEGETLAHDEGVRFYLTDVYDCDALGKSLDNLLAAWRDIDIIILDIRSSVAGIDTLSVICDRIGEWRKRLPFCNPFGGRIVLISSKGQDLKMRNLSEKIKESLGKYNFTVNSVVLNSEESPDHENISRLCLFLTAPGNEIINGVSIDVC